MAVYQKLCRCLAVMISFSATTLTADERGQIQIDDQNPRYWQYKGRPILLLGGSKTDHIFLAEGLQEHLDEIAAVGANYVRNTMSQRFVEKLLSESLKYPNVLYCMNNETSTDPKWGQYWMTFIRQRAQQEGVSAICTDMFDDVWKPIQSKKLRLALDDPRMYPFLAVSQVNSRTFNEDHWNYIKWIAEQREAHPRPLIYFTNGGSVTLDLTGHSQTFDLRWINVSTGEWDQMTTLQGGSEQTISTPAKSGWVATIVSQ